MKWKPVYTTKMVLAVFQEYYHNRLIPHRDEDETLTDIVACTGLLCNRTERRRYSKVVYFILQTSLYSDNKYKNYIFAFNSSRVDTNQILV